MSKMSSNEALQDKLSRIKALKSKKNEALAQGKKDLLKNFRDQKLASSRQAELASNSDNFEDQDTKSVIDSDRRKRVLEYSIEESEQWDRKQKQLKKNQRKHGYHNMNTLAESSYNREIKGLEVDKDSYRLQKQGKDGHPDHNPAEILKHKPSKDSVNQLVVNLELSKERKASKRRNKGNDSSLGYINDKNKQFNMKLDRQYGS